MNGECPVLDLSPVLARSNRVVAAIWEQAQRSANQVTGKDKVYIYCRPADVEALLRVYQVPPEEWAICMRKVTDLDDVANGLRLIRKAT